MMPDHVVREIKPQSKALAALQALSRPEGLSQEEVTAALSSSKPGSPGSGSGSSCQLGVTFSCTCLGAIQGEGWVGRVGYIIPRSACPCEEAAETAAGSTAAGGTRRHHHPPWKSNRDGRGLSTAVPAGWSCRLREGQGEFSPLNMKQILPADGGRSWIKCWVCSGYGCPRAGPQHSCGQKPGLLLVVPEVESERWQTRCQISSISLISKGSLSPAAMCPCRRRAANAPCYLRHPCRSPETPNFLFPSANH